VARGLRREMEAASDRMDYEQAAILRDKVRSIERTMEDQKMAAFARTEQDVLGLARAGGQAAVQLFVVRNGSLIGRDVFLLEADPTAGDDEVLAGFVGQYYARASSVPPAILAPTLPADAADVEAFLATRRGRRVRLLVPRRGEKRRLVELAGRNAAETLAHEQARWLADDGRTLVALEELAAALGLPVPPTRIECYDISTFQEARRSAAWSSSRMGSRARGSTAGSGSGTSRARTTSPVTRRCCGGGSTGRRRARRGVPRRCAGPCPI